MKKYGQSIIEYILIAVLVILGIVVMGAYVLRSTDAHFKLWDEGVQDSFQETLTQAPQSHVPNIPLDCNCTNGELGCGLSSPTSQCGANEMTYNHICTPNQGCDGQAASFCVYDQDCCKAYYPVGCGTTPVPPGGAPKTSCGTFPSGTTLPSGSVTCPTIAGTNGSTAASCYYGQKIYSTQCSGLPIICVADSTCSPSCTGITIDKSSEGSGGSSALFCVNNQPSTTTPPGLDQSYPITYVSGQPQCSKLSPYPTSQLCVMYCNQNAGFIPIIQPDGSVTGCVDQFPVAPAIIGCSPAQPSSGSCTATSTGPCCNFNGGSYTTINNQSFSICSTVANINIGAASATTSTLSSLCTACSCCTDNCNTPGKTCNCTSPSQCTGAGATPGCECLVNLSVTNT